MKNIFGLCTLVVFCIIAISSTNALALAHVTVEVSYTNEYGQYQTLPGATITVSNWRGSHGMGVTNSVGRLTFDVDNTQDININAICDTYTSPPHHYYGSKRYPKGSLPDGTSTFIFIKTAKWW